jgi:hypothetical protein
MMTNDAKKVPKSSKEYFCQKCDYKCSRYSQYERHELTAKHKMMTNDDKKVPKSSKAFICDCGKEYKYRQGLSVHKRKCTYKEVVNESNEVNDFEEESYPPTGIHSMIGTLVKENQDFKKLLIEQSSQMMELAKNSQTINNNTTNNNTQFNLNFFLNDTCKDAMNITDFIGNMNVNIDELEYIGHNGYVNGMTKMIMDRLKDMDITKRPIHCTDIKRETMYIKDQNEWSKDTDELTKLRKILTRITMNNYRTVPQWKNAHPKCEEMDTRDYNFCYKMMRVILGDVEEAQIRLDNKIIKTMAKGLFCK